MSKIIAAGVFIVDNLTALAQGQIAGLDVKSLVSLLPDPIQIPVDKIRIKHLIIEDNNPCYGEFKLCKILEIKLAGERVSIIPVDLESKEPVNIKVEAIIKTIMEGESLALVPVHINDKNWSALIIKQFFEDGEYAGIRIIYNDSRGLSINAEDTLRNFISQITKTQSDINVADIKLKQQSFLHLGTSAAI